MTQLGRGHQASASRSAALLGRPYLASCVRPARTSPGARIFNINGITGKQTRQLLPTRHPLINPSGTDQLLDGNTCIEETFNHEDINTRRDHLRRNRIGCAAGHRCKYRCRRSGRRIAGFHSRSSAAIAVWTLTTSDGRRIIDIRSETEARRIVHTLGTRQLRGPYSWNVVDNHGRLFVAEITCKSGE